MCGYMLQMYSVARVSTYYFANCNESVENNKLYMKFSCYINKILWTQFKDIDPVTVKQMVVNVFEKKKIQPELNPPFTTNII